MSVVVAYFFPVNEFTAVIATPGSGTPPAFPTVPATTRPVIVPPCTTAVTAAALDHEAGRQWRPLEDTAVAAQFLYEAGGDYADYRRGVDFYPEGMLLWLDVDVTIRQLSKGAKSLDDALFGNDFDAA